MIVLSGVGRGEVSIAAPGCYSVDILVNGEHRQSLSFVAVDQIP
jgi:hypothetical protein